ncbi:hypothetical protein [Methanosarcina horonobensis]|uniref:hypothetical protein n=1 Tax=Methanosarcina horonobensis TaxID=418008 RepID=UPI000A88A2A2|nr:hypothetical protein [Methanosarcina horonobensis]
MQATSTLEFRQPDLYRATPALKGTGAVEDEFSEGFRTWLLTVVQTDLLQKAWRGRDSG